MKSSKKIFPDSGNGYMNNAIEMEETDTKEKYGLEGPIRKLLEDVQNEEYNEEIVRAAADRWKDYAFIQKRKQGISSRDPLQQDSKRTGGSGLVLELGDRKLHSQRSAFKSDTTDSIKTPFSVLAVAEAVPTHDTKGRLVSEANRSLLNYFARVSKCQVGDGTDGNVPKSRPTDDNDDDEVVDLSVIEGFINSGADVNCCDKYGQTILHEAARTWHVDVTRFLVEEMKADVNQPDFMGRTPLHVAAAVDYGELCKYLIEKGANKEAETEKEKQTPLYFAARNDAVGSLRTLIKLGCEYKNIVDHKKRSPLYVAAELDRSETARLLLDMGAPADVCDEDGQPVMIPLISKMAPVAKEALNHFHIMNRANRKQYFHLFKLDPTDPEKDDIENKKWPSAIRQIVKLNQYDLIMHASVRRLIDVMWDDFAKWRAYGQIIFQILYILSWSVFGVLKDWTQRHEYVLPAEAHRIVILGIAVVFTVYQIVEEILEWKSSKKKFEEWKKWRIEQLERDREFCHPRWREEEDYLDTEKSDLDDMAPAYFSDPWNYFDWMCYLFLIVCIITHSVDIAYHSLNLARWHIRIMAFTVIILWLRFMKVMRAFALLGPFIVMLGHMVTDVIRFGFLYLEFFIPYAFAFWMIMGGEKNLEQQYYTNDKTAPMNATTVEVTGFTSPTDMLFSMFRLTLVDDYDYDNMIKIDHVMAQILVGTWFALSAVLCLNLFIALLSDTFQRVYDNAQANAVMQKAITIIGIQEGLSTNRKKDWHEFLKEKCNPEQLFYDDDTSVGSDNELQKATIEIRDDLKELKEKFETYFDIGGEEDIIGGVTSRSNGPPGGGGDNGGAKMNSAIRNLNIVSQNVFEAEVDRLREEVTSLRKAQNEMSEKVSKDIRDMRELLKDVAIVITGVEPVYGRVSTTLHSQSAGSLPPPPASIRRHKKRSNREAEMSSSSRELPSVLMVQPAIEVASYSEHDFRTGQPPRHPQPPPPIHPQGDDDPNASNA